MSMLKKKTIALLSVMLILSLIVGCNANQNNANTALNENVNQESEKENSGQQKSITLRLSEPQVDDYPDSIAEKAFAEMVEERTDGRIKIEVYTGGQLGDEKTTIEQTMLGIVDIGRANAGPLTQFAEKFGVFSFPFLFDSREHLWNAIDGKMGEALMADLETVDLIGLAFYDAGARSFYSKEPIRNIDDVQGKLIRVMQNDLLIEAFELIGASPTPMSASEVYSALQTGVISGGENNVSTYVADGHFEVAKNFTLSEHLRIPGVLFMSKKVWDQISAEDQQIILEAAKESEAIQMEEYDKYSNVAMEKVKATGENEVITLSDEDRKLFQEKVQPLYDNYQEQFGELFQSINDVR